MNSPRVFPNAIKAISKRPSMFLLTGAVLLIVASMDYFFPFSGLISVTANLSQGTLLDSLVQVMNIIIDPKVLLPFLLGALGFVTAASLVFGFFFSGVFGKLVAYLNGDRNYENSKFSTCLRKHFIRTFMTFWKTGCIMFIFLFALILSAVPAIMITRVASSTSDFSWNIAMYTIDIITIIVLFLAFFHVSMYLTFWFPATIRYKKAIKAAKIIVNNFFGKLLVSFIIADIFLALGLYVTVFSLAKKADAWYGIPGAIFGLIILDFLIVIFFSYIFTAFYIYVDEYKGVKTSAVSKYEDEDDYDDDYDEDDYDDDDDYEEDE
jgi:hypothetical protein